MKSALPPVLLAALQLWRKRRLQALLSTLGIVVGVAGLVLVMALGEGARREMEAALGGLGAGALVVRHRPEAVGGDPLTPIHQRRIARLLGGELAGIAPLRAVTVPVQGAEAQVDAVEVIATNRHYAELANLSPRAGRFIADRDLAGVERVCVLGGALGRRLFPRGQVLGQPLRIDGQWFRVVGWLQAGPGLPGLGTLGLGGADQRLYVPLGTLTAPGDGALDELLIRLARPDALGVATAVIRRVMTTGPAGVAGAGVPVEVIVPVEVMRQKHRPRAAPRLDCAVRWGPPDAIS